MGILYGNSGCLLTKAGITKLSQLLIDADKDWGGYGMFNLKELAPGMQRGDVLTHNGTILVKLSPANIGDELTSNGPGQAVEWKAPPTAEG